MLDTYQSHSNSLSLYLSFGPIICQGSLHSWPAHPTRRTAPPCWWCGSPTEKSIGNPWEIHGKMLILTFVLKIWNKSIESIRVYHVKSWRQWWETYCVNVNNQKTTHNWTCWDHPPVHWQTEVDIIVFDRLAAKSLRIGWVWPSRKQLPVQRLWVVYGLNVCWRCGNSWSNIIIFHNIVSDEWLFSTSDTLW